MQCSKCGTVLPPDSVACYACGLRVEEPILTARAIGTPPRRQSFCTQCGRPLEPTAVACGGCGAPVGNYVVTYVDPKAKSKVVAGVLGIFLGSLGVHRFYLGYTGIGVAQIVVTLLTSVACCGVGALWGTVEGILILVGSTITTDAQGRPLKD